MTSKVILGCATLLLTAKMVLNISEQNGLSYFELLIHGTLVRVIHVNESS